MKDKSKQPSLNLVLVVPFLVQIFAVVGLVGWLSFQNSQKAIHELATQLENEVGNRVSTKLDDYLEAPPQINQINADAIEQGNSKLSDFQSLGKIFCRQIQLFKVGYINFASPQGEFIGAESTEDREILINESTLTTGILNQAIFNTNNKCDRLGLTKIEKDTGDAREEAWYADAVKAGKPIWSKIYQWQDKPEVLSISHSYPLYNAKQELLGVIGVDYILSQTSDFLRSIRVGGSGKVFILEPSGMMVASSAKEKPFKIENGKADRLKALESRDPLIQATTKYVIDKFGNFRAIANQQNLEFDWHGARQYLQVRRWQDQYGLDWLIVVVVPESDFMASINANTQATIILCVVAFLVAIALGILTAQWITLPILKISSASGHLASRFKSGQVGSQTPIEMAEEQGTREIQLLAQSFNQMASSLKQSFINLEETNNRLESQVRLRTAALSTAKEAAEAASYTKSQFLAHMSHELRTPLNAILGFTQLIMWEQKLLTPDHQEYIQTIYNSGKHLLSLISDILEMSKIEAGSINLEKNICNLVDLIYSLIEMLQLKANEKEIELITKLSSQLPPYIQTDETKLRQILLNLLTNAIKFTNNGSVTLSVYSDADSLKNQNQNQNLDNVENNESAILYFVVKDTGIGIATNELDRIFEAFVQTNEGKNIQGGAGLGLAISRRFAQLMQGDISVDSILGEGTTFTVTMPVQMLQYQSPDNLPTINSSVRKIANSIVNSSETELTPKSSTFHFLIAEDNILNQQVTMKILQNLGYTADVTNNGKEALNARQNQNYDLILMDMQMPEMDGLEATRAIRKIEKEYQLPPIKIVALTANALKEDRDRCLESGMDDYLSKPLQIKDLRKIIDKYIGLKP